MTVTTVYAGTADAYISSGRNALTYATARAGDTLTATDDTTLLVGQRRVDPDYFLVWQSFLPFDLSGIGAGEEASAVTLSLDGFNDFSTNNDVVEAHEQAFGTVTTADWQDGDAYNATTPLATWNMSGYSAGYNAFTSDASFVTALDLTAMLELILISTNQVDNSAPTSSEYVVFSSANTSGTTADPKLDITHTTIASGYTPRLSLLGVG